MKGIIFNYLEEYITENHSLETWEELLDKCPMKSDKIFVGPGTYPSSDFLSILNLTAKKLNTEPNDLMRNFGYYMFHFLARDYPAFIVKHTHPKEFLKTVDNIIHVEVKKLFKEASPPRFEYEDPSPDRLVLKYFSHRKMCPLIEGMIRGVEDHFQHKIQTKQTTCLHKGGKHCEFELTFEQ